MRDVTLAYQQYWSKKNVSNLQRSPPWLFQQTTRWPEKITPNRHLPNFLLFMAIAIPMKTNLFSFTSNQLYQYSYNLLSFTIKSHFNLSLFQEKPQALCKLINLGHSHRFPTPTATTNCHHQPRPNGSTWFKRSKASAIREARSKCCLASAISPA